MPNFDNGVSPPNPASYNAPLLTFAAFGGLANDFDQGQINKQQQQLNQQRIQQGQQQQELATLFQGGMPLDKQGNPDYPKMRQKRFYAVCKLGTHMVCHGCVKAGKRFL